MSNLKKDIKQNDKEIKETLKKLIKRSKDGIAMIETIENCYNVLEQENPSEQYMLEKEKRKEMKKDLTMGLNRYLEMYKEMFGEYKDE